MRIAFLITQSLESPSGLGRYWPVSKELARLGHEVTVIALHHDFDSLVAPHMVQDGVRIIYAGQMHVRKVGNDKLYYRPARLLWIAALASWRMAVIALKTPADVYHVGKPHPMNGVAALVVYLLKRKPVFLDCDDYEAVSNRFDRDWQRKGVAFVERYLPRIARGVTTNTHATSERLRQSGISPDKIVYVPNGVDRDRFAPVNKLSVDGLRDSLGLVGRKVVLYVGSLSLASHPVDLLINAFDSVWRVEPAAFLLIVGGGEDYVRLQAQVQRQGLEGCVRFTGRVSADDVPAYYRVADVTVDPVYDDPTARSRYPLKVVESLVVGTPVVTSDVGDRAELLRCGGGRLVPPGDPEALAKAVLQLVHQKSAPLEQSEEAQPVKERFFWDVLVHDFLRVYRC